MFEMVGPFGTNCTSLKPTPQQMVALNFYDLTIKLKAKLKQS